jgi:hypothetical protein
MKKQTSKASNEKFILDDTFFSNVMRLGLVDNELTGGPVDIMISIKPAVKSKKRIKTKKHGKK